MKILLTGVAVLLLILALYFIWFTPILKEKKKISYIQTSKIAVAQAVVYNMDGEVTTLVFDEENWKKLLLNLEEWKIEYEYEARYMPTDGVIEVNNVNLDSITIEGNTFTPASPEIKCEYCGGDLIETWTATDDGGMKLKMYCNDCGKEISDYSVTGNVVGVSSSVVSLEIQKARDDLREKILKQSTMRSEEEK